MSNQHFVISIASALVLFSLGCSEREIQPPPVEPATEPAPVLTSTTPLEPVAPTEPSAPSEQREPEDDIPEAHRVEAPVTGDTPSFEPTVETIDGVTIQRFVTASEIERREPVGVTSSFGAHHDKVYAFVEVSNESDSAKKLLVHFIGPEAKVAGGIALQIPPSAPRWRTWAYTKHFDEPGLWRVEIRDEEGRLLGALPFQVEPRL